MFHDIKLHQNDKEQNLDVCWMKLINIYDQSEASHSRDLFVLFTKWSRHYLQIITRATKMDFLRLWHYFYHLQTSSDISYKSYKSSTSLYFIRTVLQLYRDDSSINFAIKKPYLPRSITSSADVSSRKFFHCKAMIASWIRS